MPRDNVVLRKRLNNHQLQHIKAERGIFARGSGSGAPAFAGGAQRVCKGCYVNDGGVSGRPVCFALSAGRRLGVLPGAFTKRGLLYGSELEEGHPAAAAAVCGGRRSVAASV